MQAGQVEVVLRQMADYMEKEKALLSKVGRTLAYPAFLLLVAGGVIVLLLTVTLPPLSEMLSEFDAELPLPTRLLVGLTTFVGTYKLYLLGLIVVVVALAAWSVKRPAFRRRRDMLLLAMPLIGSIIMLREMAHFSRMMSTCLSASLPMPETMDMVVGTTRNGVAAKALADVRGAILEGRRLSQPMRENPMFPRLLVQMVTVGEEAGTLDEDLQAIAETYEAEVEKKVNTFMSLLEPGLMLFLGLIVAFIAVSVIMSMYSVFGEIE